MKARQFFENSPMREITVTGTLQEWLDVLTDIDAFEGEMSYNDFGYESLEKGTEALVEALRAKGVRL